MISRRTLYNLAPILLTIGLSLCTGCVVRKALTFTPVAPAHETPIERTPVTNLEGSRVVIGHSVGGRPIEATVFGRGSECVLLMASIHGNESAGTPLLNRLAEHLENHPELVDGRQVILIPVVNPDGHAAKSRFNARRVDLNRNFPANNRKDGIRYGRGALSEPETQAIVSAIRKYRPIRIVSFHQPAACIDYDGPAADLATQMASSAKLKMRRLGAKPGSLGSWAGVTLGIPTITVELPGKASRHSENALWERYGEMLLTTIQYQAE